jgi:serine/threonine protein kinase
MSSPTDVARAYTHKHLLGVGAFGSVYQGSDAAGRTVALKVVSRDTVRRHPLVMLREIVILRRCSHPSILEMHDLLGNSDGGLTLVLDFGGINLCELIRLVPKDPAWGFPQARYIMFQTLCAVHYLHSAGIVHRDLTPSNITTDFTCR